MNLTKLFNWTYLTERYPEAGFSWPIRIILLVIFIGALIAALYAFTQSRDVSGWKKKAWNKIQVWGWSTSLVGLLLVFFREVRTLYLSSRIWLILWLIFILVWLVKIIYYWQKVLPAKLMPAEDKELAKWLPKKKKK